MFFCVYEPVTSSHSTKHITGPTVCRCKDVTALHIKLVQLSICTNHVQCTTHLTGPTVSCCKKTYVAVHCTINFTEPSICFCCVYEPVTSSHSTKYITGPTLSCCKNHVHCTTHLTNPTVSCCKNVTALCI